MNTIYLARIILDIIKLLYFKFTFVCYAQYVWQNIIMKLNHLNIVIASLLVIMSCSKEVPSNNLVERDGIKYEVNSQTPFSGTSLDLYTNGQYKEVLYYKKGKPHGQKERFYENGQLASTGNYIEGNEDGSWQTYHENGQLASTGNYIEGNEDGIWNRYDILGLKEHYEEGELKSKGNFKMEKEMDHGNFIVLILLG